MGSNEEDFIYAMQLVTSTPLTMVLATAINLKVFETIANAKPDARLSAREIASRLLMPNKEAPDRLDRMLRLLASHSIVTCSLEEHESRPVRVYALAPVAKYFIPNIDGASLCALIELAQNKVFHDSWFKLEECVSEGGFPFEKVHEEHTFEYMSKDMNFKNVFNDAMTNHTIIVMKIILECYNGFDNLTCMVDVGGGSGVTLNLIVSKHPTIKGINFDLSHVIQDAPLYPGIEHVAGDMFQEVPQGDAIFMKWILHDWSDDQCVKLLKNCYKTLPDNGKVIVVEAILSFLPDTSSSSKVTSQIDTIIMTQFASAKERTEEEFLVLAKDAGFKGIEKRCFVCNMWVMEFYK